jgi:hypothetical protein
LPVMPFELMPEIVPAQYRLVELGDGEGVEPLLLRDSVETVLFAVGRVVVWPAPLPQPANAAAKHNAIIKRGGVRNIPSLDPYIGARRNGDA